MALGVHRMVRDCFVQKIATRRPSPRTKHGTTTRPAPDRPGIAPGSSTRSFQTQPTDRQDHPGATTAAKPRMTPDHPPVPTRITPWLVPGTTQDGPPCQHGVNKDRIPDQPGGVAGIWSGTVRDVYGNCTYSQGAEVNQGDNKGWTALRVAASNGHLDVTKCLINQGAEEDHLEVSKYLISQGAEVNQGDNKGWTALRVAASNGHLDVTKCLINQGAEVNRGDKNGRTALHSAASNGHLDVTKCLINQGAEVNLGDKNGKTALHSAASNGHPEIAGILDQHDDDGLTAIHLATQNGHIPVVESLVSHGASLNIQSHNGKTCLHEAIILSGHMGRKEQTEGKPKQVKTIQNSASTDNR
eukprot:XP_011661811.1 PREDICTED: ankyrin repeat domain-containing protein 50-like [Strongylocentrotus purpuratus]